MKYLKAFNTQSDYTSFKSDGSGWLTPSLYLIKEDKTVKFNSKRYVRFSAANGGFSAADGNFCSIAGPEFYEN